MPKTPYFLIASVSVSANSTGDITVRTDANETITIHKIAFKSTGSFEIFDWEDSRGNSYTNATSSLTIASDLLPLEQSSLDTYIELTEPLVIEPASVMTISVKDTSGAANTVRFFAIGTREIK